MNLPLPYCLWSSNPSQSDQLSGTQSGLENYEGHAMDQSATPEDRLAWNQE